MRELPDDWEDDLDDEDPADELEGQPTPPSDFLTASQPRRVS